MAPGTHRRQRLGLVLLLLFAATTPAAWGGEVIDQSNTWFTPALFQSVPSFSPMGQSFTPSLSSLTFFDVYSADFSYRGGVTLEIEIFSGILQNPLGTSFSVSVPPPFEGLTHFTFSSPLALLPGNLYSAQVVLVSGDNWGLGSGGFPTYSRGDEILGGVPSHGNDLWFREGTIPEPSSFLLLASGWSVVWLGITRFSRK